MKIAMLKWYLDEIAPDGAVRIGYAARLKLGWFPPLRWASSFLSVPGQAGMDTQRWRAIRFPSFSANAWSWVAPGGDSCRWIPKHHGCEIVLADTDGIRIAWNCHSAKSDCVRQGAITGEGYVESIRIELEKPALPFKDLWWGRAHAGGKSLVWIRWGNGIDRFWLLRDGSPVDGIVHARLDGSVTVETSGERWHVVPARILRDRDLRKALPKWLVALAGSLPFAREHKFLGEVRLEAFGSPAVEGLAIGEIVQWD